MESAIDKEDLLSILETARQHGIDKEYGKCCSYYLLLFNYQHSYCGMLEEEFLSAICEWLKKLLALKRLKEISSFLQTCVEICTSIKVDIVLASSKIFFEFGYIFESAKMLSSCRETKITNYSLEENIEQLYNMLIDRWHYRMLNDKKRNLAYYAALTKAYQKGHRKVIDVGSGSGIFSLLASKLGYEIIYSCEVSDIMCDIQTKCISANDVSTSIQLINKLSTEMELGKDFHEKPTLLITEIFDCGLLGEGVLPILINAWENLLDVEHAEVIPHSAIVYGVCIECEEIRRHSRYEIAKGSFLYGCKDPGDKRNQPYTTEYIAGIKGGYKSLSNPFTIKSFDFNCVSDLRGSIGKSNTIQVPMISDGILDAIMVYFSLNINSSIKISTLDEDGLCWEQAIYSIPYHKEIKVDETVSLEVFCGEDHLNINVAEGQKEQSGQGMLNYLQSEKPTMPTNLAYGEFKLLDDEFTIDRRLVARLNDNVYIEKFKSVIFHQMECLKAKNTPKVNICFICCKLSIFPLFFSEVDFADLYVIDPSNELLVLLKYSKSTTRFKFLSRPFEELASSETTFDMVISEPIDCNGLIMENYIEDISMIKHFCSTNTIFIPEKINAYGHCFSSDRIHHENRVSDDNIPQSLILANFINEYQVKTHPDIDGNNLGDNMLSDKYLIQQIDLCKVAGKENMELFKFHQSKIDITFMRSGELTGLLYWFDIVLSEEAGSICTEPADNTHWHQACFIFQEQISVTANNKIALSITRNRSNFHFVVDE